MWSAAINVKVVYVRQPIWFPAQRSELCDVTAATGRSWVTRTVAEGTSHKCMDLENLKIAFFIVLTFSPIRDRISESV